MTLTGYGVPGFCVSGSNADLLSAEDDAAAMPPVNGEPSPATLCYEQEIKLEGAPEALEAAFASLAGSPAPARNLMSIYYDTADGALWASGRSLRVRRSQGRFVQTLKWRGELYPGPDTRSELDVVCTGDQPDIALFGEDVVAELAEITEGAPLVARFGAQMRRRIATVELGGAAIEAAFDIGNLLDGDNTLPVREIELELKDGDPANLYEFAEQLSAAYNLRLGVLTKSQRGYLLAAGEAANIRRAQAPQVDAHARLDDLIAAAITECLDHFVTNWPPLLQSDNADAIHQMRVGIRRLRSMLKIFHREVEHPKFVVFRKEAQEIASALSVARDTDVFLRMLDDGPFKGISDAGMEAFRAAAVERREEGYGQAHAMLAAPQTTRFVLELRAFVARRGWREGLSTDQLIQLGDSAVHFAARALEKLDRKARKMGKDLEHASAEDRHELRIVLKNIRYSSEMFGGLFLAGRGAKKFGRAAAVLQEVLGVYNDAAVANNIIADVERRAGAVGLRAAGMVSGWTARGLVDAGAHLREEFRNFRKSRRFWA